jgi:hypothetical protein
VYEVITSLDDEVARVWTLNWRLPKLLFMLNRYVIRIVLVYVLSPPMDSWAYAMALQMPLDPHERPRRFARRA